MFRVLLLFFFSLYSVVPFFGSGGVISGWTFMTKFDITGSRKNPDGGPEYSL
jgi:hypothetical protein